MSPRTNPPDWLRADRKAVCPVSLREAAVPAETDGGLRIGADIGIRYGIKHRVGDVLSAVVDDGRFLEVHEQRAAG